MPVKYLCDNDGSEKNVAVVQVQCTISNVLTGPGVARVTTQYLCADCQKKLVEAMQSVNALWKDPEISA